MGSVETSKKIFAEMTSFQLAVSVFLAAVYFVEAFLLPRNQKEKKYCPDYVKWRSIFKFTFGVGDDWNFLLVAKCIETVARVTYISFFCFDQSLAAEAAFSIVRKVEKSVNLFHFF